MLALKLKLSYLVKIATMEDSTIFTLNNPIISSRFFHKPTYQLQAIVTDQSNDAGGHPSPPPLSRNAQKKLLKQQWLQVIKADNKASIKEDKKRQVEAKRKQWQEKLSNLSEEEKLNLIESTKAMNKERKDKRTEERESKMLRLCEAKKQGLNIVVDLQFSHLMAAKEIRSLVRQIMYCYAVNGRSMHPAHLWLTGYEGEIERHLQKMPGFDKWIIDKDNGPYIKTFESQKEHLVYLTPDSKTMLSELDPKKIYIVGGLVDKTRQKGITMKKAVDQGIQTAKLPIRDYLKMSSCPVLPLNQVIEILVKFLETKDWKASFFHVIPRRKRCKTEAEMSQGEAERLDR